MSREQVESLLDRLLEAKSSQVHARINAHRCGTSWDYQKASEAEDRFEEIREEVINQLTGGEK